MRSAVSAMPPLRSLIPSLGAVCALFALLGMPASAANEDVARVDILTKGGAPKLALRLVEQMQGLQIGTPDWYDWERRRLKIYKTQEMWDAVSLRIGNLPPEVPAEFRRWAFTFAAEARLSANDPESARRYLRQLIWNEDVDAAQQAQWRRLVIRSYLTENNLTDAQAALLRYQQEFRARSDVWQVLHAEILLRAGSNKRAFEVLAGAQSFEARLMRLLAGLRAEIYSAKRVWQQASKLAGALGSHPATQRHAWTLVAQAAAHGGDLATRVDALERALAVAPDGRPEKLFPLTPDELWQSYDRLAESLGNRARLVVGQDRAWLHAAEGYKKNKPHYMRALYVSLMRHGQDGPVRDYVHQQFAESLLAQGYAETLQTLYLQADRYRNLEDVPGVVRYRLADKALAAFDIQLAARLMRGLDQPPEQEDPDLWNLRRARVLVYAGQYAAAVQLLRDILDNKPKLDVALAERLLQVIFDLQAVERDSDALALLASVYQRVDNERMRREILYWQAESRNALGQYFEAAEFYFRSATFGGLNGEDPWGHTARFHAAAALARGGSTEDARGVYVQLLKSTADPKRRATIERSIQQLWLQRDHATTP